jgi:hypothetical protein
LIPPVASGLYPCCPSRTTKALGCPELRPCPGCVCSTSSAPTTEPTPHPRSPGAAHRYRTSPCSCCAQDLHRRCSSGRWLARLAARHTEIGSAPRHPPLGPLEVIPAQTPAHLDNMDSVGMRIVYVSNVDKEKCDLLASCLTTVEIQLAMRSRTRALSAAEEGGITTTITPLFHITDTVGRR